MVLVQIRVQIETLLHYHIEVRHRHVMSHQVRHVRMTARAMLQMTETELTRSCVVLCCVVLCVVCCVLCVVCCVLCVVCCVLCVVIN